MRKKLENRREFLKKVCPTIAFAFFGLSFLEACSTGDDSDNNPGNNDQNGGSDNNDNNNNPLGYVKGIFNNGSLVTGEVFNAFKIDYSDHNFIKKIIIKGRSKTNKKSVDLGEVFFENGDRYEGEIDYDTPQGKGTMYYKEDGTHLEGEWFDGNLKGK